MQGSSSMALTPHTLAPISESRGGGGSVVGFGEPRRSLRTVRPSLAAFADEQQHRRHTLYPPQQQQPLQHLHPAAADHRPSWRRTSSIKSSEGGRAAAAAAARRLENTYRTGPTEPFQMEAVKSLLMERLAGAMRSYRYNAQSAAQTARTVAQDVKNQVKQQQLAAQRRYKIVVLVTVTEPSASSGLAAARALWSADSGDACARAEFRNSRVAACAVVFALYCE